MLLTAYTALEASLDAASYRGADLDPAVAGYAFAVGSVGFANAWLALASLAVCAGWIMVATGIFGRWLGWWAISAGEDTVIRAQESAQGCGGQLGLAVLWLACGSPDCLGELGVTEGVGAGGVD